ncbi:MAG: Gmad2 immunoglobulin-like domain-containing protein [Acidimicrobiales bacterium]|nr:hypothetical protein [Actinomycetota bacterium]
MDDAPDTPVEPGPPDPAADAEPTPQEAQRMRLMVAAAVLAVVAVIAVVALVVTRGGDDEEDVATGSSTTEATTSTTTTTLPTTTTTAPATTTTAAPPTTAPAPPVLTDEQVAQVVWPDPATESRFTDPMAAATSFAVDLVGFTDPVVGAFQQGDSRSGEIEVRPREDGPVTTVLVRQVASDDSWWVIGAITESIEVDEPAQQQEITDPVHLAGRARAFEGTVDVRIVADGSADPVGTGFVTGRGDGVLGPFEEDLRFDAGGARWGVVVFSTASAEDGRIWEATVVRVAFAPT